MLTFYKRKPLQTRFFIFGLVFILTTILLLLQSSINAFSFDVPITWDENNEKNIIGYRIFTREEGRNYNYDVPVWSGSSTNCIIYNLDDTITYYFVARAINTSGIESEDSNELRVELIDGEVIVNPATDSGSYITGGCFITAGALDL